MSAQGNAARARPLEDITVVDVTTALAGPFATLLLAGLGARVIKVENPAGGDTARANAPYLGRDGVKLIRTADDDMSLGIIERGREKLGVTLNLKHPRAREVYADLVRLADVVVENYSRGTADRLGVGYDFVRAVNPRAIYCAISGFGADGEPGTGKAMDTIIQALSGLMMMSGDPDQGPVRAGLPFGDLIAPLFGVIGILAALHQRQRTGQGQFVDISMLGALTSLVACEPVEALERVGIPVRTGQTVPRLAPFGVFPARDGYVAICAPTDAFARGVLAAMGRPDLIEDERFRSRDGRVANADELHELIRQWTSVQPRQEVLTRLEHAGVPAATVRGPKEAVRDPRVLARRETVPLPHPIFGPVGDVYGFGLPIIFSGADCGYDRPAPWLGEHNRQVYGELLGYSAEQLAELSREGVI